MAIFTANMITLTVVWDKENPADFTYFTETRATSPDDTKEGGAEQVIVRSEVQSITRTQFRGLTGAQIESQTKTLSDDTLNTLGSGAGTHTVIDDTGS